MKRIVTWVLSTISIVVLLFGYHTSTSSTPAATQQTMTVTGGKATTTTSGGTGNGSSGGGSSGGGSSGNGSSATQKSTAQTSKVTGSVIQTRWGPVQVQLTVSGGKITDVAMLQYPNGNGTDQQISSYALPILMQDTMSAQSANIDMVSGATYTSTGYLQSLQSAIDQAGI
jgi:uncharacterized protein with FMN-binding domain